jgi:type III secretory pathway component EscT
MLVQKAGVALIFTAALATQRGAVTRIALCSVVGEVLIGTLIGIPVMLVCELAQNLAEMCDAGRGQTLAAQYGASADAVSGTSGYATHVFVWTSLVLCGVLEQLVSSVIHSLSAIPLGTLSILNGIEQSLPVLRECIVLLGVTFVSFIPIAILFLCVDCAAAGCQILLPAAHLHVEAFIVKSLLGGLVLLAVINTGGSSVITDVVLPYIGSAGGRILGL